MAGGLRARWGQPTTGIIALICFTIIAWVAWYIFSDPRGPVASFPYPFVMYLAMMILVGLWQHMFLGDWPFEKMPQPARGIVETLVNLVLVWFMIHVVFYRILGLGFNFLSMPGIESMLKAAEPLVPAAAVKTPLTLEMFLDPGRRFAERAVVCFVLIGFFAYPFVTILFGKWPIRPSDLPQPQAGLAEIGWGSLLTLFFYTVLIVPFWGMLWGEMLGKSYGLGTPWWGGIAGTRHVHWVFGWWEWMVIVLFLVPNVWRMKPWSALTLPQPAKGLVSFLITVAVSYFIAWLCVQVAPTWINMDVLKQHLPAGDAGNPTRFLWYHAAEIAGFTLIPLLVWHHYLDDMVPLQDLDSWAAFWFRTIGVLVLAVVIYLIFYYANFGHWGLGNHHMEHGIEERLIHGESLIWNFWWIIPLLWNEWFFHKWPFYVHDEH